MADDFDPVAWLKTRDPLGRAPASVDEEATRRAILDRVVATSPGRRGRSRRLIPVAAAAAVLIASGSGVAAVLLTRSSNPDPVTVLCFGEASLDASRVLVERRDDPVGTCRRAWIDAEFAETFGDRPVPPLGACTLSSGLTAVFPDERADVCESLGLAMGGSTPPQDDAIRKFNDEVTDALDRECLTLVEVEQVVRDRLASTGLDDWTVVVEATALSDVCGSIAVDPIAGRVRIVAVPPAPPPAT